MDIVDSNSSSIPYRGRASIGRCCNNRQGYNNISNTRIQTMKKTLNELLRKRLGIKPTLGYLLRKRLSK